MTTYASLTRLGPGTSLVVDSEGADSRFLKRWLERAGHRVEIAISAAECRDALARTAPDLVIIALNLPDENGVDLIREIRVLHPRAAIVVSTAQADIDTVVSAMQGGAYDYLVKPPEEARLLTVAKNAIRFQRLDQKVVTLEREAKGQGFGGMVGQSEPMKRLFRQIDRVAGSDVTVLVRGESGTGKELVARAIHEKGSRSRGPFVAINCAAIPETLQESELFGHEKGSFTGATDRRVGRFEQADGGTLFFDEVGELTPALQAKLLRVLQERTFSRVGGSKDISADVRIVAATHRRLEEEVEQGRFRSDLYYRLVVVEIETPPLRDREGDIALLALMFLDRFCEGSSESERKNFDLPSLNALVTYGWPGNVRELQNAVQRALVLAEGREIRVRDLPRSLGDHAAGLDEFASADAEALQGAVSRAREADPLTQRDSPAALVEADWGPAGGFGDAIRPDMTLRDVEEAAIRLAIERHGSNLSAAARSLGISRSVMYRKLDRYGIDAERPREKA